ncbi:MAG: tail fiber domain-containing protein [Rhodothermales bacterium]
MILALALLLTAAFPEVSQARQSESFVEKVAVSDEAVTFLTEGNYVGFTMQVAGPEDFYLEQQFSGDEAPNLQLESDGGVLVDGPYTIQVSAQPAFSDELRSALEEARAEGDRAQIRKLLKEAGISGRAMVYSLSVGVFEGKFLDPKLDEASDEGGKMGYGEDVRLFDPVRLTTPSPDLTGQNIGPLDAGYVTPPDVTRTTLNGALKAVDNEDLPPALAEASDPDTPWYQVYFQNTAPDGSPLLYQGFLRPVDSDSPVQVFETYFREAAEDGTGFGPWYQGYIKPSGESIRLLNQARVDDPVGNTQAPLFDYVVKEDELAATPEAFRRDILHNDDVIIFFSLCVGNDCVNGESFGFDTIRLKENNLRIHFDDTSTTSSFPRNDWRIIINDSSNGGNSYFRIEDSTGGRAVFEIRAGAPSRALFVDSQGDLGLQTSAPATDVDIKKGDTPTVRLQQDGTSGFTPQTWDMAGNEAGFFIRDVTNGSTLPFRIRPGASSSMIDISADDEVGINTSSPVGGAELTIKSDGDTDSFNALVVQNSSNTDDLFEVNEDGANNGVVAVFASGQAERIRFSAFGGGRVSIGCAGLAGADIELNSTGTCNAGTFSQANAGDTQFTASSSRTLKENIVPLDVNNILEKFAGIDVYSYDFIEGPKDRIGLMAEDFHQIFGRGSDKTLSGHEVQLALWMAVQQLAERNKALEAQNDELAQRLARIEALLDSQ